MQNIGHAMLLILLTTVLAMGQSDSDMQGGTNFQGRVRYDNNTPARSVVVELWTDGESTWRAYATTNGEGKFEAGAPCSVIQYKIEAKGFRPVWGRVDMSLRPCRALEEITLRVLPGTAAANSTAVSSVTVDARIAAIPPEAKKEFDLGQKAVGSHDFSGSVPHLQKAIELYPKYAEAYQLLAVAQLQTHQAAEAEGGLLKALEIEEKMPRAQYLLGVLYAMSGRASLAQKPLSRFAELDPQNPDAYFELAKVSYALDKSSDAEARARRAIELKESNAGVRIVLGYALLRQKKPEEAQQAFREFLRLAPDSAMVADVKNAMAQIAHQGTTQ
jgi:Flp pilus assembly protein TadD